MSIARNCPILEIYQGRKFCANELIKNIAWKMSNCRAFFGPYFSVFELNTKIYVVNLRIKSEYRKMRTRQKSMIEQFSDKSPWLDNSHSVREFHAVSRESSKKNHVSKSFAIKIQKELQNRQTWILAPDIGQNPVKNRVISGERCFTLDTVVRCEVNNFL